jgi:hypothetical protein
MLLALASEVLLWSEFLSSRDHIGSLPNNGCPSIVERVNPGMFIKPFPSNGHLGNNIKMHLK